mmetsp:Transcript_7850/g.23540  ORF Transcript_7850/g.23540 Transcript_7850/m.23540 type:complete len:84 (+) Transcript_7850:715-966(+)
MPCNPPRAISTHVYRQPTILGPLEQVTILKQVMEEKLDASNVEVASVRMPTREAPAAPGAACHYVPGAAFTPVSSCAWLAHAT